MNIKSIKNYFTPTELFLWSASVLFILISFMLFDSGSILSLAASLVGVTSLIFNAKGNPAGQLLMIIFSVMYGIISFSFAYYGEMITYLCMTAPMALIALISWLRNPFEGRRSEVAVNHLKGSEYIGITILTVIVTVIFYFILSVLNTANLIPSTISVATSFFAVMLTYKRSPLFAVAYASNDLVLIVLWTYASLSDSSYLSVVVCFIIFFINDIYGYINWKRIYKRQNSILYKNAG